VLECIDRAGTEPAAVPPGPGNPALGDPAQVDLGLQQLLGEEGREGAFAEQLVGREGAGTASRETEERPARAVSDGNWAGQDASNRVVGSLSYRRSKITRRPLM
jgi:hypothetical protein